MTVATSTWSQHAVAGCRGIDLAEVLDTAALQDRVDRKYLLDVGTAERVLDALQGDHRVLEVDGRRVQAYSTVYFDSHDLTCHREHVQGRRRRWKARTRRYLDSDLTRLELKTKGPRGRTVKVSTDVAPERHGVVDDSVRDFLDTHLLAAYGRGLGVELVPVLEVGYLRTTLVADGGGTRLTMDTDLQVRAPGGAPVGRLQAGGVLVETKSGARAGRADRVLREHKVQQASCSKYCLGTAMAAPALPSAPFRPLLRKWFEPAAALAA